MSKQVKIIIALIILGVAGFFLAPQLIPKKGPRDSDLEKMKQSIIASPKVSVSDLTAEQMQKYSKQLEGAQKAVVNFNFDNLGVINDIARLKRLLGDLEGARIAWEYANIIRPKNSLSFSNLAALYHYDLKQYDKAEENYLISIANDPDDIPTIRNLYELYYYSLQNYPKTEALLLKVIEDNPQASDLTALLAGFYADIGNREKAIEYYEKHLVQNPKNEAARKELERLKGEK